MDFEINKVISNDELSQIFYSILGYEILESNDKDTNLEMGDNSLTNFVEIGKVEFLTVQNAVTSVMEIWVERMDKFIELLETESLPKYKVLRDKLLFERGFTFEEYCDLFDTQIPPSDYLHYPAFAFLGIQSDALRRHFTSSRSADVNEYIKILSKIDVRVWSFFLQKLSSYVPFGELLKHCYISGKSGSGKSEVMKMMFYNIQKKSQRKKNASLILIDPHGDLAEDLKKFHLNKNPDRLIYIDAYLQNGYTPTINPLQLPINAFGKVINDEDTINIISEELVKVFQELLRDSSLSNQMKAVAMPCIATLLRKGNASLIDLQKFMDDDNNSEMVKWGMKSPNPSHRNFFATQFYNGSYKRTKSSLFTKIQSLLNSHTFYNLVSGKNTVHLEQAMNEGKIIIFNLSKGRMGVEASEAFGRFVIATIQTIAQRRANIPENKRKPSFVFIDEFQNYITDSIQIILKEARKYRVPLILANQTTEDIRSVEMLSNILNNTEVKLVGRNGVKTLKELSKEIGVKLEELQKMKKYHFYVKAGDRTAHQFKTNAFLKSTKYQLNDDELENLKNFQLAHYYKPIESFDSENENSRDLDLPSGLLEKMERTKTLGDEQHDSNRKDLAKKIGGSGNRNTPNSPKPKFDL